MENVAFSSGELAVLRLLRRDHSRNATIATSATIAITVTAVRGETRTCARVTYLTSRDSRRSASGLPPVWQVGQYWNDWSANDTSRTVSPQTGQGRPVRACTRRPERFSPLSDAAP